MTVRQLYTEIRRTLAQAGLTAAVETSVLFELAAGQKYTEMNPEGELPEAVVASARVLLTQRLAGEPLQYLAGRWPFLDFELEVGPGVLIPRPETETVALAAIDMARPLAQPAVLDLCAGSGCIAIAIARALPAGRVTAVEREPEAFGYLQRNTAALAPEVETIQADVFGFEHMLADHAWDVLVSNPPYVTPQEYTENLAELRHEPPVALLGGEDGLDFYRHIAAHYKKKLKPGGWLVFEIGAGQADAATALLEREGYRDIETRRDQFGQNRMVCARMENNSSGEK